MSLEIILSIVSSYNATHIYLYMFTWQGRKHAKYANDKGSNQQNRLDPNHTNFILVDDRTQNDHRAEIAFRAKLEAHISSENSE